MTPVGQKVSDGRVLKLIELFLKQGILDGLREWTPEEGSPQGGCVSPLLSMGCIVCAAHELARQPSLR